MYFNTNGFDPSLKTDNNKSFNGMKKKNIRKKYLVSSNPT
jgi:hypothetical protein